MSGPIVQLTQPTTSRVVIRVTTDEHAVTTAVIAALSRHPDVYQRGGILVHVLVDAIVNKGTSQAERLPRIAHLPDARLREMISEKVEFERFDVRSDKWVATHPPKWVIEEVAARGQWENIRKLTAVSTVPLMRADGSIVSEPGYDLATGVLFIPLRKFPKVAEKIDEAAAKRAMAYLLDIFFDFKFQNPEHRSGAIAGILTPLARQALRGCCTPLLLIDKNVRGAGGSLLADAISLAATGRTMPRMVQAKEDDEERKRIIAIGLAGTTMVLLDNISRPLGGPALDAALTGAEMSDRLLGRHEEVTVSLDLCWYATGNNVQLLGDTVRRVLPVKITVPIENPEDRINFKHDPLMVHVLNIHPMLAVAALTILRGYVLAGSPDMKLPPWGSFEGWSKLIRNAIVWCGEPDPAIARKQLAVECDTEANSLRALLENWEHVDGTGTGITVGKLLATVMEADPLDLPLQVVKEALMDLAPTAFGKGGGNAVSLGKRLKHFKGRVVGKHQLSVQDKGSGNLWRKRPAGDVEG